MPEFLVAIIALLVLPFLFPDVLVQWLQTLLAWLEKRRIARDQEIVRLQAAVAAHGEWNNWLAKVQQRLAKSSDEELHTLLLTQALAAGERYLQEIDQHSFPQLYVKTEKLRQRLRIKLSSLPRSTKKGQTLTV